MQVLKPLIVDVVNPLMPQVDIRFNFLSFGKHCGVNIVCVKDEHPPFSSPLHDDFPFFLDEATKVGEPDLHPLVDALFGRNQILGDCWDVQGVH